VPHLLFLDLPIIAVKKLTVTKDSNPVFGYRYIRGARFATGADGRRMAQRRYSLGW
jgi:hypothetical protein